MNRTPSGRGPVQPHPQHQLPERPDIARQTTLERRDTLRDARDAPRQDSRGRQDTRLPEKPPDRRHSPRREPRESRDSREISHRHEEDRRGLPPLGREAEFQRVSLQQGRDERGLPKDDRMSDSERGPRPGSGRGMQQMPDPDQRRLGRDERDGGRRRSDRHDPTTQQTGRLNDYSLDRPEISDRRMPIQEQPMRKPDAPPVPTRHAAESTIRHPAEDMLPQRAPPAGPRSFDRRGQPSQKELFTGPQGGNQMRGPPSGPTHGHPSEQFREARHPASGNYHHQDPNHGRLNPPDPVIPKGPRDRNVPFGPRASGPGGLNIRGASQAAAQQAAAQAVAAQIAQQQQSAPPPSIPTTRQLPSPSMERKTEMPPPAGATDRISQSAPSASTVDTAGIHPDRLKVMGVSSQQNPVGSQPQQQQQGARGSNFPIPNIPSPINTQMLPLGPRSGPDNRTDSPISAQTPTQKASPPTGPARRDDETRHHRRRILNVQSQLTQLTGDEVGREIRGRAGRRGGSSATTPTATQPPQLPHPPSRHPSNADLRERVPASVPARPNLDLDRRMNPSNLADSRRSSIAQQPDDMPPQHSSSRGGRHHRSDRDRESHRERDRDRDRRAIEAERERERERERKGSDRGGSSGKDREREREHRRDDGGGGGSSRRDRDRERRDKRPSDNEGKREDVKRRRTRGGDGYGNGREVY